MVVHFLHLRTLIDSSYSITHFLSTVEFLDVFERISAKETPSDHYTGDINQLFSQVLNIATIIKVEPLLGLFVYIFHS